MVTVRPRGVRLVGLVLITLTMIACGSSSDPVADGGPESAMSFTDWDQVQPSSNPNNWLVAADGAGLAERDEAAPVFDVAPELLAATWAAVIEEEPRTEIIAVSDDGLQIEALERSAVFGFVDRISVRVLPVDPDRSTLAAYSRSTVGYWDFGVNRRRLHRWIAAVQDRLDGNG